MTNQIIIKTPSFSAGRIEYHYTLSGDWVGAFAAENQFFIDYSCDISMVPEGIILVPLLVNLLPISWVYDAEIIVPVCDKSFYDCIADVKKGYMVMYPMIDYKGTLKANLLQENHPKTNGGAAMLFSGGVDAFNTLTQHVTEKPTLITLWGADIKLNDEEGWQSVLQHLKQTASEFNVDYVTVKTNFRNFIDEWCLDQKIEKSGDGWWHGFQHGIGIIGHAAPVAYIMGKETIYFASSFTAADKGKITCASDPTIDNFLRFGNMHVIHDGYDFTRQLKVHNIIQFLKRHQLRLPLRVCWESSGGSNCCHCEKCWRTMLAIISEKCDPRDFGFTYTDEEFKALAKHMRNASDTMMSSLRYGPIQDAMRKNWARKDVPVELRWFYKTKRKKLGNPPR